MKYTNKSGLPDALVQAVTHHDYSPGRSDITVTQLIAPPRIRVLTKQHYQDIEQDVMDRIWALLGSSIHEILRRSETIARVEERLYMPVNGWNLGGQFDRLVVYPDGLLQDYKLMSVWERIHGLKADKEQQLNVLAEILEHNGIHIKSLEVVALYRDWSKSKAREGGNYPQAQCERIPVTLWSRDKRTAYIGERVMLHQHAERELPECTDEERWAADFTYAVMNPGKKRALRVLESEEAAHRWIEQNATNAKAAQSLSVEKRQADSVKRCRDYCAVAPFCEQFKRLSVNENA